MTYNWQVFHLHIQYKSKVHHRYQKQLHSFHSCIVSQLAYTWVELKIKEFYIIFAIFKDFIQYQYKMTY